MWYFAWALGGCLAASFAILNAIWLELDHDRAALLARSDGGGCSGLTAHGLNRIAPAPLGFGAGATLLHAAWRGARQPTGLIEVRFIAAPVLA